MAPSSLQFLEKGKWLLVSFGLGPPYSKYDKPSKPKTNKPTPFKTKNNKQKS